MVEKDPGKLADRLEEEADDLKERSEKLGEDTENAAKDWERKRADPNVPGAPAPEGEDDAPPTGAPSGKRDED